MTRMMKDSGVEWIGEIPENWKIVRNKNIFSCSKNVVGNAYETTQLLSLTKKGIKEKDINDTSGKIPESYETYQFVKPKQIVMCLFDLDCSAVFSGISKYFGMISPAYDVLDCKNTSFPLYYDYWFSFVSEDRKFRHYAKNLRYTLNYNEFACLPVILPPLCEQEKIAEFLDDKCGAIDEIISKTEQSIEEYKKLKQSVITKAVTKGIRPNRPMQDSNIEWIGEIPTDWEIKRFRYIADKFLKGSGITKDDVKEDGNIKCVRYGEIYSKYNYTFNDCLSCTNVEEISAPQYFSYGDLLFAGTGELIEEIGKSIVYLGNDKCLAGGDIIVVKHRHNPAFLNYMLNSDVAIYQKSRNKIKLKVVHISAAEIKNIIVPLPPLEEQKEIADYLDEKCAEIDTLIEKKQQFLSEMANYRKSLIYEYVTGKKEVA